MQKDRKNQESFKIFLVEVRVLERGSDYKISKELDLRNSRKEQNKKEVQANKSTRGMPWHREPMKDATSCDKLRGVANIL